MARRRSLPSGRAVAGGLLVAAAAVGTFLLAGGADAGPAEPFVVARRPIDPGQRITAEDLVVRDLAVDDAVAARTFRSVEPVVGSVAVAPLEPGDLVQASAVVATEASEGRPAHELTFTVPQGRVPPGLRRGERLTLLATLGSGASAVTRPVLEAVPLVNLSAGDGLSRGDVVLTVAVEDPAAVVAGAHAARVGELTVVRLGSLEGAGSGFAEVSTAGLITPPAGPDGEAEDGEPAS